MQNYKMGADEMHLPSSWFSDFQLHTRFGDAAGIHRGQPVFPGVLSGRIRDAQDERVALVGGLQFISKMRTTFYLIFLAGNYHFVILLPCDHGFWMTTNLHDDLGMEARIGNRNLRTQQDHRRFLLHLAF